MVARLRLFDVLQVLGERFFTREGGAVEPLQHRVFFRRRASTRGHAGELDRADGFGVRHVRAATQIHPGALWALGVAVTVQRDGVALRQTVQDLQLEVLAELLEQGVCFGARHFFTREGPLVLDDAAHLLLDGLQVLVREGPFRAREVVIEARLDGGADGDLRSGEQTLHRVPP